MNKNLIAAAVLSLPVLVACENRDPEAMPSGELTLITATISDAETTTRSAIDPTEYAGGHVGILWTPEDIVGVYSTDDKNIPFRNQSETAAGRTQFAGECASPLYAYYPWLRENDGSPREAVKGHLASEQTYDSTTGAIEGDYKYGTPSATAQGEFNFKHIFSLLRFNLDITGIDDLAGESLKSVVLELPAGRQLAGDFTFDITNGSYNFMGETSNIVTMRWADSPRLEGNKTYQAYMTCAPDMKAEDKIKVTVNTDRHSASFTATVAYDFVANEVYTFNLKLNDFKGGDYGFAVEELPAEPEEETANCYMITTAGEHDFKATVIGNGEKGIIPGAGFHTEDPYINPRSAKLLWEDTQGFVTDVTLRDGRVHYTASGNKGNALIAVYSGADATGDILWSWHIWGVGDTLPEDCTISTKGGSLFNVMDRNLGAFPSTDEQRLETTRTQENEDNVLRCMLYQWGRKDPIPNSDKYWVDGNAVDIADSYSFQTLVSGEEATILNSVRNPDKMIDLYKLAGKSDWVYVHNEMLWGDEKFSGNNDAGWTGVKTIYDPSPVGYRVANYYTFTELIVPNSNTYQLKGVMSVNSTLNIPSLAEYINCVISTQLNGTTERYLPKGIWMSKIGKDYTGSKNIFGHGIYFKRNARDEEGNFFGQVGCRRSSPGDRYDYGVSSYLWLSCGAVPNTIDCGSVYLGQFAWRTSSYNTGDNKGLPQGSAGVVGTVTTQNPLQPVYACAVRCVREK